MVSGHAVPTAWLARRVAFELLLADGVMTLRNLTTSSLALATLIGAGVPTSAVGSPGRTDFAERSYQDGLELMAAGRNYEAIDKFEYAIRSARRNKKAPKPNYFLKNCEATVLAIDQFRVDQWEALIASCDEAIKETSGAAHQTATKLRARMAAALGKEAAAKGKKELDGGYHDDAQKWYGIAVQIDPRPAYYLALCESHSTTGSGKAAASCAEAAKGLRGEAKKLAQQLAQQAGEKPTAAQASKIEALEKTVVFVDALSSDLDHAKLCLAQVKAAEDSGVKPHHRVAVGYEFPNATMVANPGRTPNYYTPFSAIEPFCRAGLGTILAAPVAKALEQADYWSVAADSAKDENDFFSTATAVESCRKAVGDALSAGLDPQTVIKYSDKRVTLADAEAKVCTALEKKYTRIKAEIVAKAEAERQAKLAPYKAVLNGDKWKLYEKYGLDTWFQGRGGAKLKTPDQHKKAKKWFLSSVGRDRATGLKTWRLTIFVFRGNKLRKTDVKNGRGDTPPSKAFR